MLPRTTVLALLLLITVAISAKTPCDPTDSTSLCLKPLRHSARSSSHSSKSISSSVVNRRRGARRAGSAGAGAIAGAAIGAARRPRGGRRSSSSDDEDDDADTTDEDDDNFFESCFPANARVTIPERGVVTMADLLIGDTVSVAGGASSPVYMFSHRITRGRFPFVKIATDNGELTASEGHYIYADGRLVTAGSVRKGDRLELADGQMSTVTGVDHVIEEGLYNPHTLDGELVVNGFRVSVYTKTVEPLFAESLLAPIRAGFRILGIDVTGGAMSSDVPKFVLNRLPKGTISTEL